MSLNQGVKTAIKQEPHPLLANCIITLMLVSVMFCLGSTVLQVEAKINFKIDHGSKNKKAGNYQKVLKQKLPMPAHMLGHINPHVRIRN